jgi:sulfite reductase (ferredoxin)
VWLGGDKNQTRLAQQYQDKVKVRDLDSFLDSLFFAYAEGRSSTSEAFGDWVNRLGLQGVKAAQQAQQQKAKAAEPVPA